MIIKILKGVYERYWADFHFWRRTEWNLIYKWINPKKGDRILDVACGGGIYSRKLASHGCVVSGIDLEEGVIKLANKYNKLKNAEYKVADAHSLPFGSGSFDKVFSVSSIEHFKEDSRAFSEMRRVLKPNGILVISVDSFNHPDVTESLRKDHAKKGHVVTYYTRKSLSKKVEKSGFKVERCAYRLNSKMSSILARLWIRLNFTRLFLLTFPLSYPLSRISDIMSNRKNQGYVLVMKATKK